MLVWKQVEAQFVWEEVLNSPKAGCTWVCANSPSSGALGTHLHTVPVFLHLLRGLEARPAPISSF